MTNTDTNMKKPFISRPSDENTYHFMAEKITFVVTGEQTNGEYSTAHVIEPPKLGPPLHIHHEDDEEFYILKGSFTFYVGDEIIEAKPGDYVFAPKGIPHRFVSGSEQSEFLVRSVPAKFDAFVKELGVPVSKDAGLPEVQPPTAEGMKHFVDVSKKYSIVYPELKI